MPKSRMTALDVRACVNELKGKVLGAKVFNVYDVSNKIYIIKAIKNGVQYNILLESGVRIHTTTFLRDKSKFPNTFSQKLRKHIRDRRIEAIRQIGFDRIVDIVFGNGENTYHLILEMYAGGNLILTNYQYDIMFLLRSYKLSDGREVDVNQQYHYEPKQHPPFDEIANLSVSQLKDHASLFLSRWNDLKAKEKNLKYILLSNNLLSLLGSMFVFNVLSHLQLTDLTADQTQEYIQENSFEELLSAIQKQAALLQQSIQAPHGYIVANEADIVEEGKVVCKDYQDFAPFSVHPSDEHMRVIEITSFNDCIDQYYINDENYRVYLNFQKSKEQLNKRVDNITSKQNSRIRIIQKELSMIEKRIHCLITNSSIVNTAIVIINQFLSQGIQWNVLRDQVEQYKKKPYNIFHHVKSLDLDHNRIKLELPFIRDDDDEEELEEEEMEEENDRTLNVDIELSMNCNNNIALMYKQKKEMEVKLEKTLLAAEQAISEASKQREKDIIKTETQQASEIVKKREKKWFEKFDWFVTSEGYIVIAGKSGDQNELLVKKYLRPNDMHADVHGAASVIIRNYIDNPSDKMIPELSLQQAAVFALCHSVSWDNNLINKVYWVFATQVSKVSPTGEPLPGGSFMIRGKKNFLSPYRLEMGIGLLFEIENDPEKHIFERYRRDMDEEQWQYLIKNGVLQTSTTEKNLSELEQLMVETAVEDEEYSIEVMDSVTNTSKNTKVVSKPHPVLAKDKGKGGKAAKGNKNVVSNKKSLKGTTKKSRAAAEEEEILNALIAEEDEKRKPKELSRGEKRKMKKMKKASKLDDEEAQLLAILHGHASIDDLVEKEKKKLTKVEKENTKSEAIPDDIPDEIRLLMSELVEEDPSLLEETDTAEAIEVKPKLFCYTCGSLNHIQSECPESWRVIEHIDERLKEEATPVEVGTKEDMPNEEETIAEKNEDLLLSWTAHPLEEDIIVHAIPVCAPYAVLTDYRYHVKLTAGKMKKGAIAKVVVEHWLKERMMDSEKRVIKHLSNEDLVTVIMNNSKVTISGKGKK